MGREIKRVALDFDHGPDDGVWPGYVEYRRHCKCEKFVPGEMDPDDCQIDLCDCPYYYEPPVGEGWQVWETVSEGSPTTPVFATREELIEHLTLVGAGGVCGPVSRQAAEKFVEAGWAPSLVGMSFGGGPPQFMNGVEAAEFSGKKEE